MTLYTDALDLILQLLNKANLKISVKLPLCKSMQKALYSKKVLPYTCE